MSRLERKRGSTSVMIRIRVPDNTSTTGAGLTGLTNASTNLVVGYMRELDSGWTEYSGANIEQQTTIGTFQAPSASTKIRFKEISFGYYELQFHDSASAFGTGDASQNIIVHIRETTTAALKIGPNAVMIPLVPYDPQDGVRLGLTALPNANASASGGLPIIGTGSNNFKSDSSANVTAADVKAVNEVSTSSVTTINANLGTTQPLNFTGTGASALVKSDAVDVGGTAAASATIGTVTTVTNQLTAAAIATGVWQDTIAGDFTVASSIGKSLYTSGNAPGAASGLALAGSNMGSVTSVSGAVGSVTGNVGGNVVGSVGSVTAAVTLPSIPSNWITAAGIAAGAFTVAVWDGAISGHTTSGTFGGALNAAGSAGDPWATTLPGAYSAGTAGFIVGTSLDATVSSRSTYAGADTAGTTTLLTRLTSTRAGYLDNLSGGAVALASGVTVTTNNDKTGYSLTQSFPTNFASLAITVGGSVTVGTNNDKTGYSISGTKTTLDALNDLSAAGVRSAVGLASANLDTQLGMLLTTSTYSASLPANFGALTITGGAVTVGTNNDKIGYSLSATGLDSISVADPGAPASQTTLPKLIVALWRRFFGKTTLTSSQLKTYKADGTSLNSTQAVSDDGTTQTQGEAS